jgi:tyrosine-specific transport protein
MIRCELNINSRADFSLKDVGLFYGGKVSAAAGDLCLKILSFSLLAAYIFGGSSIIRAFLQVDASSSTSVAIIFTCAILCLFLFLSDIVIKINKYMFMILFSAIFIGIISLTMCSKADSIPINVEGIFHMKDWSAVLPVVFTSFGFQGSLHSLTKFVDNDRLMIKKACLFGSLIPAVVYILWTACILTVIFNSDPASFSKMLLAPIEVSELIRILSTITNVNFIQHAAWIVSFLAILTSIIGVGLSLGEVLKKDLTRLAQNKKVVHAISVFVMIIPSAIVAIMVPNAFIRVLNFAGIILTILAIALPVFFFTKMNKQMTIANICNLLVISTVGIAIVFFGIYDIIQP